MHSRSLISCLQLYIMANPNDELPAHPVLNKLAVTSLFTRYISDVYHAKQHISGYLPWMVSRASTPVLRMVLLNTSSEIQVEILRLEFICKIVDCNIHPEDQSAPRPLNLSAMLEAQLKGLEADHADFVLIAHMVFLETMETASFQLLTRLARGMGNKSVVDLLAANLKQAKSNRGALNDLADSYLCFPR